MDDSTWDAIDQLVRWLDTSSSQPLDTDRLLRLMKLSEEVGEVNQAVAGVLGTNPRKGTTHTWDDVHTELCDVILTAMVALATLTPDARKTFAQRLDHITERSLR